MIFGAINHIKIPNELNFGGARECAPHKNQHATNKNRKPNSLEIRRCGFAFYFIILWNISF